jgi:polyhydroxyalkanoate synthesis regulator phasin
MFRKRRLAGVLVAALVLAVAVAGVAVAASDPQAGQSKTNLFQNFIEKFAGNLGVGQDEVVAALDATKKQILDEAVQQGRLTQEQADKIAAAKNGGMGWFGDFQGRKHGVKPGFREGGRIYSDGMADVLGITPDQLKTELQSGKKLSEIIADHGFTAEQFNQEMLEIKKESLSKAVADGKMTQEQADRMMQKMEQRFDNKVPGIDN